MRRRPVALIATLALVLAACSPSDRGARGVPASTAASAAAQPRARRRRALRRPASPIYGAASLKAALAKVKTAYEAANAGTTLTISTDSSSALETKIEQGAPADVFLSADTTNPQKLIDKGLAGGALDEVRRQPADRHRPDGQPGRDHVARPTSPSPGSRSSRPATRVPITKYATQLVANLAKEAGYPGRLRGRVHAPTSCPGRTTSRRVVSKVELGEGDAGDRLRDRRQDLDQGHDRRRAADRRTCRRRTAASTVKASPNAAAAAAFLAWLAGPDGQAILRLLRVPAAVLIGATATAIAPRARRPCPSRLGRALARRPRRPGRGCSSPCPWRCSSSGRSLDGSLARALTAKVVLDALVLSLATTAVSLVITVAFGLPLAVVLARRRFRGSGWVEAIIDLPIVLPPSVAGLALLLVLGRRGFLGGPLDALGLEIPFTTLAVILAQTFVSAPFFVRSARTGHRRPSTATSRTRRGSTAPRSSRSSAGSPSRWPARRWRPAS